jgi:hypothetical protein
MYFKLENDEYDEELGNLFHHSQSSTLKKALSLSYEKA